MIKSLYSLFLAQIIYAASLFGQTNIPTSATGPASATAKKLPPGYYVTPVNYIRTYTPLKQVTDTAQVNLASAATDVGIATQYMDTYGRNLQTVIRKASPAGNDYVAPAFFDELGNASLQYLPFVSSSNDGKFKADLFPQDSSFYKANFPSEQINYGQQFFDASPLNIPTKTTAPGNSWTGAGVGITYTHRTNTVADSVKLWTIAMSTEDDIPSTSSNYQAGSLTVLQITDEKGTISIKYIDVLGRTILTKTQLSASPSTGHYGWVCTYYVYDEMNHVRLVIPPKAVEALNNATVNWNIASNPTINTGLCYGYFYDSRGRAVMKRIPGKGKIYIAYDLLDRVVMTQDPNLRAGNQWTFILYDGQSRPVKTGLITSALIKDSILVQAARSSNYPTLAGTYTVAAETYYDDYSWIAGSGTSLTGSLITTNINSTNFVTSYNTSPEYAQPVTQNNRTRGAVTGTKKIIVGTSTYLYSVNIFDDHGRSIQTSQTNYSGGTDVSTVQYSFSSRVLRTHLAHQKAGTNAQNHTVLTKYTYDAIGRVKTIVKNLDNSSDKTVSTLTYNELGQLSTRVFGSSIETQNYAYNIRGWILGINSSYVSTAGSTSNYFGESLSYDYGFTTNQVDGNIAGVKWKAAGDGIARAYGYTYDKTSRLSKADFTQQNQGVTAWTNDKVDYSVSGLNYDAGGNILFMKQRGLKLGNSATIDSLTYQYFANSNQLQKIADGIADTSPMGDFKDTALASDDYTYDLNGNTSKDYNRHMHTASNGAGAVYNFLDKPDSIVINGKAGIHYYYDAAGNQVRKLINDYTPGANPAVKNFLYLSGFVYLNDTLQYILHEEGRIRYARKVNSSTGAIYYAYEYDYFIKDHQGNVRTVLTEGKDTAAYAATMESRDSAVVRALFKNVYDPVNTVYPKPAAFDSDTSNHYVSRLNASSGVNLKTGPSIVLKVMKGDQVQLSAYAYYITPVQPPPGGVNLLNEILPVLAGGMISNSGGKMVTGDQTGLSNVLNPNVNQFLTDRTYDNARPKAYLNWILFDDQFNYISSGSGVQQVLAGSSAQALTPALQTISKNGYFYVYVSNESQQDVYFDKLTVKHYSGPLAQEQSYYPFGLQMAGISDKALLKPTNPYKYNGGSELEEDYGVSYYNTFYRKYDPQIGRFTGVDMLSEQGYGINPYHFGMNNPIFFNDPTGSISSQAQMNAARETAGGIVFGDGTSYGGWNGGGGICLCYVPGAGGSGGAIGGGGGISLFNSNAIGDAGSPAAAYVALQILLGNTPSTTDSYLVQLFYETTFAGKMTDVSASLTPAGVDVNFTAMSTGISHTGMHANLDIVQKFIDEVAGYGYETSREENSFMKYNDFFDISMTATDAYVQGAQKIANLATKQSKPIVSLEKVPVLGVVSTVATGITTGHKLYEFFNDPKEHWIDGLEALGTIGIAIFAPEALILYQIGVTIVDLARE